MVISFQKNLPAALQAINDINDHHLFPVHELRKVRTDDVLSVYGDAKWKIVDILNERYSSILSEKFDLYNWLHEREQDEVAYFLNEAGSNCLSHSEFKAPSQFHLWLGPKGFVIGIQQNGKGFDARHVHEHKIKDNKGAAFDFFRRSRSSIFFDDPEEARTVFMEYLFSSR